MQQTPSEIVTEIIMSRDSHPWLAVEGYSDIRLLRSRTYPVPLKFIIGFGWEGVRDILVEFANSKSSAKLFGLVDRDYRDHLNCQLSHEFLVLTDFRDVENMLFNSSALERVISEYASINKIPKTLLGRFDLDVIRDCIYKVSIKLGKIRIYCQDKNLDICFKTVDYKKFVCDSSLSLDVNKFLAHLNGKNPGKLSLTLEDWNNAQALSWENDQLNQPQFIANGHDVMALLCLAFRKMWGTMGGGFTPETVETCFRIGYSDDDLQRSEMWCSLEKLLECIH
ncbi:uncharacterized protein DUF4435 [Methylobacter tundripaludum]|uniref:Uncharacterized protein DUF4435 n=1 Tax=Methylobacter tundripaludum TaxID=173365 RepID=A0A2S6H6D8_9GAMM|nr:DUF4435 domain-containing protein [Methylobacter tundripaludum]PPK72980.1 uncharacterized protein DUF4435 [Methylobacter tundripaludum]